MDPHRVITTVDVPLQPAFSSGDVAVLLSRQRSVVTYWVREGKLPAQRDFRGHSYITREDLVLFVRDYLGR